MSKNFINTLIIVALSLQGNYAFAQCANETSYSLSQALKDSLCVKKFILRGQRLEHLPRTVGLLRNAEYVDLQKNKFAYLPDELGNLAKTTQLVLSGNELKRAPESLCNMRQLTSLHVDRNYLVQLPANISELKKTDNTGCFVE
jgi:Leucine-rich repeat (LRR) protein